MFDFEKLVVYKKAKAFYKTLQIEILPLKEMDQVLKNQLRRSSSSIVLNIAEGCSRFSKADKRNFYVIARGSVFESVAILDLLKENEIITPEKYQSLHSLAEELSRILYALLSRQTPQEY